MPDDFNKAFAQRHPTYTENSPLWQFYRDHYLGGVQWATKTNPIPFGTLPASGGKSFDISGSGNRRLAAPRYLWQYPMEQDLKYTHRLQRAVYINIVQPVVDFYTSTVGKADNVVYTPDSNFADFDANADMRGQSFLQFMGNARIHATTAGHTFLIVDSTQANAPVVTARDQIDQGIRPFITEVLPEDMLNWRLDENGQPLEILYRVQAEVAGSVLSVASQDRSFLYRYWTRELWQIYEEIKSGKDSKFILKAEGKHPCKRIPLVTLYHKRVEPMLGESLLKDSAKIGQLVSNWASGLDEAFEAQMFAMLIWFGHKSPTDAGVGSAVVIHCDPEQNEKLEYLAPDTAPFEAGWNAFYRMIQLANKHMGISPKAINETSASDQQSGKSKEWDFFESEKVLARMATNEQDAANEIFDLVGLWEGKKFSGSIQYKTTFDLSTAQDDINDLISLQSAGVPQTARQELMRSAVFKKLPNLPDTVQKKINNEIDQMAAPVDTAAMPPPGAGADGAGDPAAGGLPKPLAEPVDKPGKKLAAPSKKKDVAA